MEQQILFKIQELKKLFNNNINNFEDFLKNKEFIIYIMEQIELFINQNFNNNIYTNSYNNSYNNMDNDNSFHQPRDYSYLNRVNPNQYNYNDSHYKLNNDLNYIRPQNNYNQFKHNYY